VLHLLDAPDADDAPRRVAVRERAPAAGPPLGVLGVATEQAHLQRAPGRVVPDVLGGADPLL
jgi:hypothetical protein